MRVVDPQRVSFGFENLIHFVLESVVVQSDVRAMSHLELGVEMESLSVCVVSPDLDSSDHVQRHNMVVIPTSSMWKSDKLEEMFFLSEQVTRPIFEDGHQWTLSGEFAIYPLVGVQSDEEI